MPFIRCRLAAPQGYWYAAALGWQAERHDYAILVGSASNALKLEDKVTQP